MKFKTQKIVLVLPLVFASCMNGPSFMKQSNESSQTDNQNATVNVAAKDENGVATGAITAESGLTQVLQASSDSSIAGSSVSFPPGSIAIDTDISISAGESVASDEAISELGLDNSITASAQPVTITSSVALDAAQAFTISLPLPDSSGLRLQDSEMNIAVFYKVNKVVAGGSFTGVIGPENIVLNNGYAVVTTMHFGTFQVAYLKHKVTSTVEVASAETPPPAVEPPPPVKMVVTKSQTFVRGFMSYSFGNTQSKSGLQGWGHTVNPARVGSAGTSLTKDYTVRVFKGE